MKTTHFINLQQEAQHIYNTLLPELDCCSTFNGRTWINLSYFDVDVYSTRECLHVLTPPPHPPPFRTVRIKAQRCAT